MTEKLLHALRLHSILNRPGCEGMTETMWGEPLELRVILLNSSRCYIHTFLYNKLLCRSVVSGHENQILVLVLCCLCDLKQNLLPLSLRFFKNFYCSCC